MSLAELKLNLDTCAICGGGMGEVLLRHDQPDRFERHVGIAAEGYARAWVACRACGSASNAQRPQNQQRLNSLAKAYYEVDLAGTSLAAKYEKVVSLPPDRSDNVARVNRVLAMLRRVLPYRSSPDPVAAVDIGAGLGVFLARLLQRADAEGVAIRATAIEPDSAAAEHLRGLGLFEVFEGLFSGQDTFAGAGLLTLNKVIEHVVDPGSLVGAAGKALAPEGVLYVEVPDVVTIGNRPPNDTILGALHHHLYTPEGLAALFRGCGLQVVEVARIFEPSGKITVFGFACHRTLLDRMARGNAPT